MSEEKESFSQTHKLLSTVVETDKGGFVIQLQRIDTEQFVAFSSAEAERLRDWLDNVLSDIQYQYYRTAADDETNFDFGGNTAYEHNKEIFDKIFGKSSLDTVEKLNEPSFDFNGRDAIENVRNNKEQESGKTQEA